MPSAPCHMLFSPLGINSTLTPAFARQSLTDPFSFNSRIDSSVERSSLSPKQGQVIPSVLVTRAAINNVPTEWLRTTEIHFLQFWRLPGVGKASVSFKVSTFQWLQAIFGAPWLAAALLFFLPSSSYGIFLWCPYMSPRPNFSYKNNSPWVRAQSNLILT